MSADRIRLAAFAFICVVLAVIAGNAIFVVLGPNPTLQTSNLVAQDIFGLKERRDDLVLLSWWVSISLIALTLWILSKPNRRARLLEWYSRFPVWVSYVLGAIALVALAANALLDLDRRYTDNFPRFTILELLVGVFVLGVVSLLFVLHNKLIHVIAVTAILLFAFSAALQSPANLRDYYHSSFSLNEIAVWPTGQFPLSNFFPQYTSLLGLPIAPLARIWPDQFVLIGTTWLVGLQVVSLCIPALLAGRIATWRLTGPVLLATSTLMLSGADRNQLGSVSTFFSSFPIRTFLPTALLVVLVFVAPRQVRSPRITNSLLVCGALGGTAALNNPDFGIPAFAAGFITLAVAVPTARKMRAWVFYLTGALSVFVCYELLGRLYGNPVDWSNYLIFQRIFGQVGYYKESMAVGGLHVLYVSLFGFGLLFSVVAHRRFQRTGQSAIHHVSVFLGFTSLWSLGTLPYFVGRSYTTTVFGHSYQFSLVSAAIVSYLFVDWQYIRELFTRSALTKLTATLLIILFLFPMTLASRFPTPQVIVANLGRSGAASKEIDRLIDDVNTLTKDLDQATRNSHVVQLLVMSNAVELATDINSALVVSYPDYLYFSPLLMQKQCESLRLIRPRYVIEMFGSQSISSDYGCAKLFDFTEVQSIQRDYGVRLLALDPIEE